MNKKIFIVNGLPRSGKDTFAEELSKLCRVKKISVIDPVVISLNALRDIVDVSGKTKNDRILYNSLKKALDRHSSATSRYAYQETGKFLVSSYDVLLIDVRNPEQIDELKSNLECKTVLIERDVSIPGSDDDDPEMILGYVYDYRINNSGTLEEFKEKIKSFYERIKE